jgi:glycosyltransferase involved in cell wall biosynthesis
MSNDMFKPSDVSVVIPSYNSRKTICACLDSLLTQVEAPGEIIIVDSSQDGTHELIAREYSQVRMHHFKRQTFPGPARNYGATLASGAIIAFIDSDCIAQPDWVKRIADLHSEGHLVAGGAIEVGNPDSAIAWAGQLGEFREFLPTGEGRHVLHIPTCNISYRRMLFTKHGGFPNAYYPQEDLLFNYVLSQHGVKVWFDPDLRIRHFSREDLRGYLSHQHRIGRVTRCTLRRIEMPGSEIAKRAWLAWLLAPVLTMIKVNRTARVFFGTFKGDAKQKPALLLLLLLGSIWWGRGFASGARTGLSGVRGWNDPDEPIFELISVKHKEETVAALTKKAGN